MADPAAGPPEHPGDGQQPGDGQPGDPGERQSRQPGEERPADSWPDSWQFGADEDVLTPAQLARLIELDRDRDLDPADLDPEDVDVADLIDPPSPLDRVLTSRPEPKEVIPAGFTHGQPGVSGRGFGSGGVADQMLPGPVLAALIGEAWQDGLGHLSDDELVGVALAAQRTASWQAAVELAAVTELSARRQSAVPVTGDSRAADHFGQEIAVAFTLTNRGADAELDLAAGLERLPQAAGLLAAGIIDRPRAKVITDELACVDADLARAAADQVLPRAGSLTTGQLRRALRRAVLAADPEAAIRRRKQAERDARVEAWPETSGTAALAGRDLPPASVALADRNIDATARWLKTHGAPGTLANLRAAVFLALLAGQSPATLLPQPGNADPAASPAATAPASQPGSPDQPWPAGGPGPGAPDGLPGLVHLTMPLSAWSGRSDSPGQITGLGPFDAGACRDLGTTLADHPATRWCLTLTDRQGRAVAHACSRAGPGPPGTDPAAWLASLKITRLESGTCTHQEQVPGYRPSARLRHLVTIQDPACIRPGCARRSARCDQDHTIPYHQGGRTCTCNLHPVCRTDHQAKQAPGWHLDQTEPGTLTWTLPHGRSYVFTPEPYPA